MDNARELFLVENISKMYVRSNVLRVYIRRFRDVFRGFRRYDKFDNVYVRVARV